MERSLFHIKKMDCPTEEQIIRMKLDGIKAIRKLEFDLNGRNLTVYHNGGIDDIKNSLDSLGFGTKLIETGTYDKEILVDNETSDKKLLWTVLIINFSVFVFEMTFGLIGDSMGLVADALDELADAFVYGLSLYAITGTILIKKRVARTSGILQLVLAAAGFVEVIRRFVGDEPVPDFVIMIVLSCVALIGNVATLVILNKSKTKEVNIQSSIICSLNDVFANIGVILAAILVAVLHTKTPDLLIGSIVFLFVLRGAIKILKLAK